MASRNYIHTLYNTQVIWYYSNYLVMWSSDINVILDFNYYWNYIDANKYYTMMHYYNITKNLIIISGNWNYIDANKYYTMMHYFNITKNLIIISGIYT